MADNIIQAVEILVDKPMTSRPELGLYSVSGGNAELRWTEAPLTGTTKAYAEKHSAKKWDWRDKRIWQF